jgi:hypothetical protein
MILKVFDFVPSELGTSAWTSGEVGLEPATTPPESFSPKQHFILQSATSNLLQNGAVTLAFVYIFTLSEWDTTEPDDLGLFRLFRIEFGSEKENCAKSLRSRGCRWRDNQRRVFIQILEWESGAGTDACSSLLPYRCFAPVSAHAHIFLPRRASLRIYTGLSVPTIGHAGANDTTRRLDDFGQLRKDIGRATRSHVALVHFLKPLHASRNRGMLSRHYRFQKIAGVGFTLIAPLTSLQSTAIFVGSCFSTLYMRFLVSTCEILSLAFVHY